MKKYCTDITLTILGPFLTSATSSEAYGVDKTFHRNPNKLPTVPGSHIKGKLRMSLEELKAFERPGFSFDIDSWFGQPSASGSYEPVPGGLMFSDFRTTESGNNGKRTRTAINSQSMTADENKLRNIEDLFLSGDSIHWQGSVTFYAASLEEAHKVNSILRLGFKWLTNLGAEKGVGFGRLANVTVADPKEQKQPGIDTTTLIDQPTIHLRIQPVDRLMIGGVKKPRANFVRSESIIPGSVIKGALAANLNRAHGITPISRPISADSAASMTGFELLATYFHDIRITHAFPALVGQGRPVRVPISTVKANDENYDMALATDASLLINNVAPSYFIDWKKTWVFFGAASPIEAYVTRTSIDDVSRRSLESQLFTYSYFLPKDTEDRPIEWICNVDFSSITDQNIREQVQIQFAQAASTYLDQLGKLNHPVKISLHANAAPAAEASRDLIHEGQVVVTLQTDTMMLNPDDVRNLPPGKDLFSLYAAYWQEISSQDNSESSLELVEFFAHQTFQGGYLYHRYLGSDENQQPTQYYPYYLTGAGSVFILRPKNTDNARLDLDKWLKRGLDLPDWVTEKYSRQDGSLWQNCPFVPENGFGEIMVNLDWHWSKKAV